MSKNQGIPDTIRYAEALERAADLVASNGWTPDRARDATALWRLAEELRAAPPDMTVRYVIANANLPRA